MKVYVGGNVVHTGQLFFSDPVTDTSTSARRTTRGRAGPPNASDSIFRNGGRRSLLSCGAGGGYVARITMGVQR